jgi:hypothetical protein
MARQVQKTTDRRREDTRPDPQSGDWYSGERENEFGGEGRFRSEGGHGSHFGGEPDAPGEGAFGEGQHQDRNPNAWRGEHRRKFVEKFDRWRSERAARAAPRGPDSASDESAPRQTGRSVKK